MKLPENDKICIVVPVYNEEERLPNTLANIRKKRPFDHIVVVDDGSKDRSVEIAENFGVSVVRLPIHLGYGVAVQTGLKYSYDNKYNFAVTFDGDGQHEPSSIEEIKKTLINGEYDIVVGSRFLFPTFETNFIKRCAILLFSFITKLTTKIRITDPTSGFIGFNRKGMQYYIHDNLPHKYPDTDALIMLHRAGVKIGEAPVVMYPSTRRSMHYGIGAGVYMANMLFSVFVSLLRPKRMD